MIEKGSVLKTKTTTKDDVFGECIWRIEGTGLPAPEAHRKGKMDGVKCILLGGSGPAAKGRNGFTVIDSVEHIEADIAKGVTVVIDAAAAKEIVARYEGKTKDGKPNINTRHGGTGVVEV